MDLNLSSCYCFWLSAGQCVLNNTEVILSSSGYVFFSAGCLYQEFCWLWILLCCDYFLYTISFKFLLCYSVLSVGTVILDFFSLFLPHSQISVYLYCGEGLVLHPQKSHSLFLQYPIVTQITFIQCVRGVHRNRHTRWQK